MNNNRNNRRCTSAVGASPRPAARYAAQGANEARCGCGDTDAILPVMAYVPVQEFGEVYSECQALHSGTLFPALDKPFSGKGCSR